MSYGGYQQQYQPPPPQGSAHGYYQQSQGHYPPPTQGQHPPPQQGQYPPPPQQQGQYGYGAPPPGQYPPTQQPYGASPYGAPPPQEMYGSPASQGYGQHHQAPYGQPPPPQQGGAHGYYQQQPPQGQYGAAPMGQPPYYGAAPPPPFQGPPTAPSPGYGTMQSINWNADADANAARAAMKGFGTDEKALTRALATKDPLQITAIRDAYQRNHRRDLIKDITSETSGWLEKGLVAVARGPLYHDCYLLYEAMDGPGTKEKILNDVLLGRSNADINAIKSAYRQTFRRDLTAAIKDDLSLKTERHFVIVLGATRAEDSAPVIKGNIDADVEALYNATEGKRGTDEMKVCSILSTRNDDQIRAIAHEYQRKYARDLDTVIKREFSGHMEDALLFQLRHAMDRYMHQATLLEEAMSGAGTKDHLLVSRVVRAHWDQQNMANVKGAYEKKHRQSLANRIKGETSGDYERLMLACIGERI